MTVLSRTKDPAQLAQGFGSLGRAAVVIGGSDYFVDPFLLYDCCSDGQQRYGVAGRVTSSDSG